MPDWITGESVIGGSTSKSMWVELAVTADNTAKTGLVYTDITAFYCRPGGTSTSITMATLSAINSSYSSGGFKELGNGVYRFDLPDAAIATLSGGGPVVFTFSGTGFYKNFQLVINASNASVTDANIGVNGAALVLSKGTNLTGLNDIAQGTAMTLTTDYVSNISKGTAGAGTSTTITIATALGADNNCVGCLVFIYGGTGLKQARTITGYVNSTKVVTVDRAWAVTPDNTSTYLILPADNPALSAALAVVAGTVSDKTGYSLTAAYDLAKTAAQDGDAMTLTSAYDAAKTAAAAGAAMTLTSGERTTLAGVVWSTLTSAVTTANSIGKRILDFVTTLVYAAAPTAAQNAAATRDVDNTSPAAGSLGEDVKNASAPTVGEIDTQLSSTHGAGQWGSSSGSGAFPITFTVNDGTNPIPGANLRMTNGINSFVGQTDISGQVELSLDAASYTLSATKSGYEFTPITQVVTNANPVTISMTPIVIPAPPVGGLVCNFGGNLGAPAGNVARAVPITFELSVYPAKYGSGSGIVFITDPIQAEVVNGVIKGPGGSPYVPIPRNDAITPASTTWTINCPEYGFVNKSVSLTTPTKDIGDYIT